MTSPRETAQATPTRDARINGAIVEGEIKDKAPNVWLSPGQGGVDVGIGGYLNETSQAARDVFTLADNVLGMHLSDTFLYGPKKDLLSTSVAQPAIVTVNHAYFVAACDKRLPAVLKKPMFVAGHSLGEYNALIFSGAMAFEEGLSLVRERAKLTETVEGAMVVINGLSLEQAMTICKETGVEIANYNSDTQLVFTGDVVGIDAASKMGSLIVGEKRVFALPSLRFPAHSKRLAHLQTPFRKIVLNHRITKPGLTVVGNVSGRPLITVEEVVDELVAHLAEPVLWDDSVRLMVEAGATNFFEFGEGNVLTKLVKRARFDREVEAHTAQELLKEHAGVTRS